MIFPTLFRYDYFMIADSMIKSGEIQTARPFGENITSLIDEAKSNNLWLKSKAIASMTVGDGQQHI